MDNGLTEDLMIIYYVTCNAERYKKGVKEKDVGPSLSYVSSSTP